MEEKNPTGALASPRDKRTLILELVAARAEGRPRRISNRDKQSGVFRQRFGSCVGAGGKSVKEAQEKREHKELIELSYKFLYALCKAQDGIPDQEGTYPSISMKVLAGIGIAKEADYPSDKGTSNHAEFIQSPPQHVIDGAIENRIDGFVEVTTLEGLKDAIAQYGEVGMSINVYDSFDDPRTGDGYIAPHGGIGYRGRHWIVATGYDDDRQQIEIKNSWGTKWGDKGFAYLDYNYEGTGALPFNEAYAAVDFVLAEATSGAPIDLAYPVDNPYVTQGFGERPEYYAPLKGHTGIDFRAAVGKPVYATDDGEVLYTGWGGSVGGNRVVLKHKWGTSYVGHLSGWQVNPGQQVKKGQRIATSGQSGNVSGPHVHFQITINGVSNPGFNNCVDATPYFTKGMNTKYFRINQQGKQGILISEGHACTVLFENDWAEYQTLLQITGLSLATPVIDVPAGKFFKLRDGNKLGIMVLDGFAGTGLFENDYTEYQTLLKITGVPEQAPTISLPQ